ncbi:MAG TPA: chemotaxis protein CheA [candidate division Zixibacteria bacterium]|nr:chemotaxis protein CheA [candidate division Zixibacteria bacterium]
MSNEPLQIPEDMRDFVDDFLVEADDLIASLDTDLVALESAPGDLELLNRIFRAAHTIKGNSSFLNLDQVTELTHKMEDVLNRLRKEELVVTSYIMDVLLRSLDNLKVLLEDVRGGALVNRDLKEIEAQLLEINEAETSDDLGGARSAGSAVSGSCAAKAGPVRAKGTDKKADQTVRVDVNRLDSLLNLVGELVLGRNSLLQMNSELTTGGYSLELQERINTTSSQISFVTTELQTAVMNLRMLPIGKVFGRFPRLIRDLASATGKKIELEIIGEETELDKTVIEEIGDPLVHLVRNSCDHGIEPPAERRAAGKAETGTVILKAAQQGSHIVVTIQDDGRGLDPEILGQKAIERGLVTAAELERMSAHEIYSFIFHAGFSTAKVVSDISGRGVGMDVVRSNIERLNGIIELDSEKGKGTTISIKLPLTLAIIQGLLVRDAKDIFIVPLASVLETVKVERDDISFVNGVEVIRLRESVLPILPLRRVLQEDTAWSVETMGRSYVVVIGLAERQLGLVVDDLLGQEEVVIKSLGRLFGNIEGLAGATILGDGRIRLITDVAGLFALAKRAVNTNSALA